jgi:NAD(P)-dependent dehydrogenase (short-subunit alcohol dehydrogenase family)
VAQEIQNVGVESLFVRADVANRADVEHLVDRTVTHFGCLDIAVNNAGIEGLQALTNECSYENWDRTIAVNLTGVFACMRAEIPRMLDVGHGAIVNVSSVAGLVGFAGIPAYTASKHGVVGLTKAAALEYATQGIRVNAVCPGVIATEMITRFTHDDREAAAQMVAMEPVGRMGTAEEIADTIVWLCSDRASFVTGQAIAVDGGLVAR